MWRRTVNSVLYVHPRVMSDNKSGSNPGCGTDGFTTTAGWDPVTVGSWESSHKASRGTRIEI
jgi:hypothetical protein